MTKTDTSQVLCAGPDCPQTVAPKPPRKPGRFRRYCSQRCRQRAYRARHTPSRQMLEEVVRDGVAELRFLPPAGELAELEDAELVDLARLVGQARAMHERIITALG